MLNSSADPYLEWRCGIDVLGRSSGWFPWTYWS